MSVAFIRQINLHIYQVLVSLRLLYIGIKTIFNILTHRARNFLLYEKTNEVYENYTRENCFTSNSHTFIYTKLNFY